MACPGTLPSHILPQSSVELHEEVIGIGGYSKVWSATYTDLYGQKLSAAAKKVRSHSMDDKEIQIMKHVNHNKHVIKFYGVWKRNDHDVYIIMERAERGDLRNFLSKCKKEHRHLTTAYILKWTYEAACALDYFNSLKISHRDVKSLNFLIMQDYTLKLGDLGLATPLESTRPTCKKGTSRWMAPEVIRESIRSPKSDIFSFGIVVSEMVSTDIPYADCKNHYQVMDAVCTGKRPNIPDGCPEILRSLMNRCWDSDRTKRPDLVDVCRELLAYQPTSICNVEPTRVNTDTAVSEERHTQGSMSDDTMMISASSSTPTPDMTSGLFPLHQDVEMQTSSPLSSCHHQHDIEMKSTSPLSSLGAKTLVPCLEQDAHIFTQSTQTTVQEQGVSMDTECELQGVLQTETQPLKDTESKSLLCGLQKIQYYQMHNKPHGLCIIINNIDFSEARRLINSGFTDRRGSEVDAEKLKDLFQSLHYTVESISNLKASDMYDQLEKMRQKDHSLYDCFVCCILTHGSNGTIYGCDGKAITILKLTGLFTANICKSLSGKPKLFIFEACQGLKKQGTTIEHDGLAQKESIPNESDFVLGYATVPGHVAYRHTKEGSWYIKCLVNVIEDAWRKHDVLTLLTMINKKLSAHEDEEGNKQTASVFNTLRKGMYLYDHPDTYCRPYFSV